MATSNEIIASIKVKGGMPDDSYFTDAEMLSIINDEMKVSINPLIMRLNEDYFLQDKDYTIAANTSYRLPRRVLGNKIRDIKLVDSSGSFTNLARLYEEDRSANLTGYYLSRSSLTLSSNITSGTLRVTYFLNPSQLVLTSEAAAISSINTATNAVVVTALPTTITTATLVDFVQAQGPYDLLDFDKTITTIVGTTLTFSSLPTDLVVGDYICLAQQSPVPNIPVDVHPLITQSALVVCLSSKKDRSAENEFEKLELMKKTMLEMLDPRVESADSFIRGQGILTSMIRR